MKDLSYTQNLTGAVGCNGEGGCPGWQMILCGVDMGDNDG